MNTIITASLLFLFLFLVVTISIAGVWSIWWESKGKMAHEKRLRDTERAREEEGWLAYCKRLDDWFEVNKQVFKRSDLNLKQLKILYSLAQRGEHEDRLRTWQILMVWGWDGTAIDQLRFDADFERLLCISRPSNHCGLVCKSGGCDHLPKDDQQWFLTDEGRDFLIDHRLI